MVLAHSGDALQLGSGRSVQRLFTLNLLCRSRGFASELLSRRLNITFRETFYSPDFHEAKAPEAIFLLIFGGFPA